MKGIFQWLDKYIQKAEAALLIGSVLLIALNSIANVLGRYLFSQSIYFSEELNYFLIIAVTFIGC
ncbi:TRAP transporter small permease, partial [Vibrio antiquarius]